VAEPTLRTAARVVLLDPSDAFLLIRSHDPFLDGSPVWWHVPGGGLDPGESPEDGAIREIQEEVGLRLIEVGPAVGARTSRFQFAGGDYLQSESFFVVRIPARVEVDATHWTELEQRSTLGWRWWTLDELRATDETVYPRGLASFIAGWLTDGPGARPVEVA
jgi:8-oxo-dGTP pyrophosphatase MutT (NUDIX family)